jgi:hypothetical protein
MIRKAGQEIIREKIECVRESEKKERERRVCVCVREQERKREFRVRYKAGCTQCREVSDDSVSAVT